MAQRLGQAQPSVGYPQGAVSFLRALVAPDTEAAIAGLRPHRMRSTLLGRFVDAISTLAGRDLTRGRSQISLMP